MFVRTVAAQVAAESTASYTGLRAEQPGEGNLFVGGAGDVDVMNVTDGFTCAGGSSATYLVNQASNCNIQIGDGGSTAISVGECNTIFGGADDDLVISLGDDCVLDLGAGEDRVCASGAGTTVDGGEDNDTMTGVARALDFNELRSLNILEMLAAILEKTAPVQEEE